jgi:hypothetical protein
LAGRGHQSFKKRQKEQQRKDRQQAKMEKRLRRSSGDEQRQKIGIKTGETLEPIAQGSSVSS